MGLLDGLLGQVLSGALKPGQDDGRGLPDIGRTWWAGDGRARVDPGRARGRRRHGRRPGDGRYAFDQLGELGSKPGPKFVFAHILSPHPPFVFDAQGRPIEPPRSYSIGDGDDYRGSWEEYRRGYAGQVQFVDRQIERAIVNTDVKPGDYLRIGVWHHPVADVERGIRNREFLGNLQTNRVRVCLTGDVHEMRRELIDYWHRNRMHVIGAGSFGSKGQDLSEGSPRLYNLLEIERDFSRIRVHTRQQPKPNGAWKGWKEWPSR